MFWGEMMAEPLYATPVDPTRPNRLKRMRKLAELMGYGGLLDWQSQGLVLLTEEDREKALRLLLDGNKGLVRPAEPDPVEALRLLQAERPELKALRIPFYKTVVISVPRQLGKTEIVAWLPVLERLVWWDRPQTVLWNAQSLTDALSMFTSKILPRLEDSPLWELAGFASTLRSLNNPTLRAVKTGSVLRVVSSGKASGHGQTAQLVVFDEAWDMADDSREGGVAAGDAHPAGFAVGDRVNGGGRFELVSAGEGRSRSGVGYGRQMRNGEDGVPGVRGAGGR